VSKRINERAGEQQDARLGGLVRSVGLVMLISTLARGLSLAGSMRYTAWFGYTLETDIYSYAVNLPNLIFTCIGTALVTVVIPIFSGRLASGEKGRAYRFIDSVVTFSLIIASLIAAAGILVSPLIVSMIGKFKTGDPALALFALRLMFPVMIFHAVNYILQGVLQSNGRYMLPAAVSAFSGLAVIIYVTFFAGSFGMRGLLIATFIGLAAQALVLIPTAAGPLKYRYKPALRLSDGDVRLAGRLALPVLVSSSSYQFNMFMNSTFAAGFDGGVLTVTNMLTLAFTASQLFIISTLSVFFPRMSARYATGDIAGFRNSLNSVMRLILIFAIPASAALAYLSRLLIPLLYGHGKATASDMATSAAVFAIYAAAVASIGFKEAADRAFYAIRDSRTPAAVSVVIMVLNITLSFILMNRIGLAGLPAAYFIAITAGAAILMLILRARLAAIGAGGDKVAESISASDNGKDTINTSTTQPDGAGSVLKQLIFKCAASSCIMLAALLLSEIILNIIIGIPGSSSGTAQTATAASFIGSALSALTSTSYGRPVAEQIIRLAVPALSGACAYLISAYALNIAEIRGFTHKINRIHSD